VVSLVFTVLVGGVTSAVVFADNATTTTSTSTTTTTIARERPQTGWAVASSSARGVMVDYRMVRVAGATFRVIRLRARTTLLRWHVGTIDPLLSAKAPADAAASIHWPSEGLAGVVAVFNGGFKQAANAGGSMADGFTFIAPQRGRMTIALDAAGHWAMGIWGHADFPPTGFRPISFRQNLGPLVMNGRPTPSALSANWRIWGTPLANVPPEPRTGLGVDANGNLLFVGTMGHVLAPALARALVAVGAVRAMQLDINPFWPILGAAFHPVHGPGGKFEVQIPGSQHSPNVYDAGWQRDFFVALAEPDSWTCQWRSAGLGSARPGTAVPQIIRRVGAGCVVTTTTTTATTVVTSTTTATTTSTGATTSTTGPS
jgi:hypothetical protein